MDTPNRRATNFAGSWEDVCPHCGLKQETHRHVLAEFEGELLEHRMPCEPERAKLRRLADRQRQVGNGIVLVVWILIPLALLILEATSGIAGWVAFGLALVKLAIEAVKYFGNPDKWIPGHKEEAEKQRRIAHYFYHCERNPEGFARLQAENFGREEASKSQE